MLRAGVRAWAEARGRVLPDRHAFMSFFVR
jgi:hypothetical protein